MAWLCLFAVSGVVAGCSGGGGSTDAPTAAATGTGPFPVANQDARTKKAIDTYLAYFEASSLAQLQPSGPDDVPRPAADYRRYSYDPQRASMDQTVWGLHAAGERMQGTVPVNHVSLTSADLQARPDPTVVLTDCPISSTWRRNTAPAGSAGSQPHPATVTVVLRDQRWGVSKIDVDATRTCRP